MALQRDPTGLSDVLIIRRRFSRIRWHCSPGIGYDGVMNIHTLNGVVTTSLDSPLGPLLAGATDEGVCVLEFAEPARQRAQLAALNRQFGDAIVPGQHEYTDQLVEELAQYFTGSRRQFTVPLVLSGTPFQRRVWEQLLAIPYGETCSYEDVARAVGVRRATRAVGSANGRNRIAIVIPCHRVISKGGGLGGYGGGLWRKEFLLDLERRG
jgi:AraC family transcriptional regulator of adaptative response/methylated-DNA-[protein]-cysteine methyltransferase